MRNAFRSISIAIALLLVLSGGSQTKEAILNNAPAQVYFSPHEGCTVAIVSELNKAKKRGEKYSAADFTAHMGVPTYIDSVHGIAHTQVLQSVF